MKDYIEETLKFIESEEMRDFLRDCWREACEDTDTAAPDRYLCAKIVSYAPASIERKIPALELIAAQTEANRDNDYMDPAKLAREHRLALDERYDNPPGTIFRLRDWCYREEGCCYGNAFFTDFDATIRYIKQQNEQNSEELDEPETYYSHTIDKYIPGEGGELVEYCEWVLNWSGDIWYFDYDGSKFEPEDWDDIMDYIGADLNLPVPFRSGDIVTADCRPFAKERRVLILDIGDNSDCCCVQCLYTLKNSKINTCAFKHNSFLHWPEGSHVSSLYRAARWHGELGENEAPLAALNAAIRDNTELAKNIWDYVFHQYHQEHYNRDSDDDIPGIGILWDNLKNEFGL